MEPPHLSTTDPPDPSPLSHRSALGGRQDGGRERATPRRARGVRGGGRSRVGGPWHCAPPHHHPVPSRPGGGRVGEPQDRFHPRGGEGGEGLGVGGSMAATGEGWTHGRGTPKPWGEGKQKNGAKGSKNGVAWAGGATPPPFSAVGCSCSPPPRMVPPHPTPPRTHAHVSGDKPIGTYRAAPAGGGAGCPGGGREGPGGGAGGRGGPSRRHCASS